VAAEHKILVYKTIEKS